MAETDKSIVSTALFNVGTTGSKVYCKRLKRKKRKAKKQADKAPKIQQTSRQQSENTFDAHIDDEITAEEREIEKERMKRVAKKMENPKYLGTGYLLSKDFKRNSPPRAFITGDDKHYVYPLMFCARRAVIDKLPKHADQYPEEVATIPLCRYIHALCADVIDRNLSRANFVTKNGTTVDKNGIFKPIMNNIVDGMNKKEDGKRQFTIIDLTEPENKEFANFLANIKNLMIMTGAVPASCFPTSDGGENQITLILQLSGALQQHFHFDFNPELYKPHRNRRRKFRHQYKEFNGVSMFLNPSLLTQTIDLPQRDFRTGRNRQLYNTPISLMLMNGNQPHAGSPNETEDAVVKFFSYIKASADPDGDETYLYYDESCEYFLTACAIEENDRHFVKLVDAKMSKRRKTSSEGSLD